MTRFIHSNHLGSATFLTDHSGATTQKLFYYPWGQAWASAGTVKEERFASMEQRDAETGLDPTLFRMYESRLYRWLSPDPVAGDILNPQSLNRYAYVLNNPVNLTDPLGLQGHGPRDRAERLEERLDQISERVGRQEARPALLFFLTQRWMYYCQELAGAEARYLVQNNLCPGGCAGLTYTQGGLTYTWVPGHWGDWSPTIRGADYEAEYRIWMPGHWEGVATVGDWFNSVLRVSGNFAAGAGAVLSLGGTTLVNQLTGANEVVDKNSGAYLGGEITGAGVGIGIAALGAANVAIGLESKVAIHGAHHAFEWLRGARLAHIQVTLWLAGVKGSTIANWHIPLPWR